MWLTTPTLPNEMNFILLAEVHHECLLEKSYSMTFLENL